MPSPGHPKHVKSPEKPDVIDLITDSESEAVNNFTTTREYKRSPQRPAPRTASTNSSATSSKSKYIPEVFDNFARPENFLIPSPDSSIDEEIDILQLDLKPRDVLEENEFASKEERDGHHKKSFKQVQTMKESKPPISNMNDASKGTPSPRNRARTVSRSRELTPQTKSPRQVEQQSPKSIRPSPRSVQTSLGSPAPRRSNRRTSAESADTERPVLEKRSEGLTDDDLHQIPTVVETQDNSRQKSEPIHKSESLLYPRFIEYKKARKQQNTNVKIIERLKEGSSPQNAETKTGWIYVLESTTHAKGHVKIGKTVDSCETREKAWGKCNFPIQQVEDIHMKAFDHCSIVESLIMLELYNSRKKFECQSCRGKKGTATTHTEWFEIEQGTALAHVQRWRRWIDEHQPFSEDGKLTGYWRWKIEKLSKQGPEIDWDAWTDPFKLEKHVYQIRRHFERKDMQYWIVGFAMLVILDKYDGSWRATLGLIALLVL